MSSESVVVVVVVVVAGMDLISQRIKLLLQFTKQHSTCLVHVVKLRPVEARWTLLD